MNLRKKVVSGLKWSTVARIGRQLLQFITLAILARLLEPSDFGLMTSAMVVIGFVNVFRDLGVSAALIQKQNVSSELFSSVFWISVFAGISFMLSLFFLSPIIAGFYNAPELITILRVLSVSFLFSGFSIVQQALLEKNMEFKLLAKFELAATFLAAVTGISLAFSGYGVWSLVFQTMVFSFTLSVLIGFSIKEKPKFYIKLKEIKSVANYSLNLSGFNIINYFVRNADYILIQKFLGEQQLGYYTLAYRLMLYPLQNITAIITRVMFPALSRIQNDNVKFKEVYIKLINVIALITFPLMLGLIAVNNNFVFVVFGVKWEPVITLILILAPLGLIQSVYTPAGMIYQAKGRTDWWFKWGVLTGILFISAFWIGLKWGIYGVALGYLIANFLALYPGMAIPFSLIKLKVSEFLLSLRKTLAISLIMFFAVFGMKLLLIDFLSLKSVLVVSVLIGGLFYIAMNFLFNKDKLNLICENIKANKSL